MGKNNYFEQLSKLYNEEMLIKRSIDTESITRNNKDKLFKQLEVIERKKEILNFKIKLKGRLK